MFLASKLFLFGKRLNAKQNMQTALAADDKVKFDAVPCEPSENNSSSPWFATLVWKGNKPSIDYDAAFTLPVEPGNFAAEIKHVSISSYRHKKLVHYKSSNMVNSELHQGQNIMLPQQNLNHLSLFHYGEENVRACV